jgi:hypothetical protein
VNLKTINMLKCKKLSDVLVRGLCILLIPFLFSASAFASKNARVKPTRILFIGNSYTHMNDMPSIFEKMALAAGKKVKVEKNTRSGASFRIHSEREDMYEAIKSEQWDYVILQGYSREFSHIPGYMDTATVPFVQRITDSIYANNPCTNVLLYMTWGYEDGYKEREEVDNYEKMADSIERGYQYVGNMFQVPVVPVGMVWKQVKSSSSIDLYAEDRAHPSIDGSYLIASTFFNAIFDESNEKIFTSTVKTENAEVIKKEAASFVQENRHRYKLDVNRFDLKPSITSAGEYMLKVTSTFSNASSVVWSFGDGSNLNESSGIHKYKRHGKYVVRIQIEDKCGIRVHERIVKFEKPKKPKRRKRKEPKYNVGNEKKI